MSEKTEEILHNLQMAGVYAKLFREHVVRAKEAGLDSVHLMAIQELSVELYAHLQGVRNDLIATRAGELEKEEPKPKSFVEAVLSYWKGPYY